MSFWDGLGIAANVLQVLGFIFGGSLIGLFLWIRKKVRMRRQRMVEAIVKEIRESTYPIQPHANGGNSLPDLSKKIDGVALLVAEMHGSLNTHLDWHNGTQKG